LVPSILVKNQIGHFALIIGLKSDLRIDDFQKEVFVALRKHFEFGLTRQLSKQVAPINGHGDEDSGGQLIITDVLARTEGETSICFRSDCSTTFSP
jgi:hypothetical protein